jgi:hypothetical protein
MMKIVKEGFGGSPEVAKSHIRALVAPQVCGVFTRGFYTIGPEGEQSLLGTH